MTFPCEIDIKVFVRSADHMENQVRNLLLKYLFDHQILSIYRRESAKGKYQSLSCKVRVDSKNEIDQVFIALGKHPDVVMVL